LQVVKSFDILNIDIPKIAIENIDISRPFKGRKVNTTEPNPRTEINPIPQAAHPGAKTPRNKPIEANAPIFLEDSSLDLILKTIKLTNIPKRTLKIKRLRKELILIVL